MAGMIVMCFLVIRFVKTIPILGKTIPMLVFPKIGIVLPGNDIVDRLICGEGRECRLALFISVCAFVD